MASSESIAADCITEAAERADARWGLLPKYQKQKWVQLMLSTIFRRLSQKQLIARATLLFGRDFDYRAMWKEAIQSGYLVKNVKAWLFWCVKKGLRGSAADAAADAFEVKGPDRSYRLMMTTDLRKYLTVLAAKYPAMSLKKFDRLVVSIYNEMQDWLGKFVWRKMRFIYQQEGLEAFDMKMTVFAKGVHALYLTYPKVESHLHAVNIVKSASHNLGVNMMVQQTHQRRARLTREADGTFSSRVVSLNELVETTELQAPIIRWSSDRWMDVQRLWNIEGPAVGITLRDMLYSTDADFDYQRLTPPQRLMAIYMGHDDRGFNEWLKLKRINSTCSEYLDRADPARFFKLACQFLEVPAHIGEGFLARWRQQLKAYAAS